MARNRSYTDAGLNCNEPMAPSESVSQKPMRIAMLCIHSSPMGPLGTKNTGGMSVYVRELAKWLGSNGHQVDIFTYTYGSPREMDLYPKVRLIHLVSKKEIEIPKENLPDHLRDVFDILDRYCSQEGLSYGLIHSHYWLSGVVGVMAQTYWQCPHLTMFHTLGAAKNKTASGEKESQRRITHERWLVKTVDGIVVPTHTEQKNLLKYYHARAENIRIIPCGVNLNLFRPMERAVARKRLGIDPDAELVLYVGRFSPLKGLDQLLGAVARLKTHMPELHLMMVGGDGPDAEYTRALLRETNRLNLQERVTFAGRIDQTDLPVYYCAADLLALPSHYESFGLVLLEALACGTPVVATAVGAAESILTEVLNGAIAAGPDDKALAHAIGRVLNIPRDERPSQHRIRATVTGYGWHRIAGLLVQTYRTLIADYRHTGRNDRETGLVGGVDSLSKGS